MQMDEKTPVTMLKGIGEKRANSLSKSGLLTLGDLCAFYPRSYENRKNIMSLARAVVLESPVSFILTVGTVPTLARIRKNMNILKFRAFDETGTIDIVFFNSPFLKTVFAPGMQFRFYGRLTVSKTKRVQLVAPKFEEYTDGAVLPDMVPIYRVPDGFSQKSIASTVKTALSLILPTVSDPLPEEFRQRYGLPSKQEALRKIHAPKDEEELQKALRRTVFEELYLFALGLSLFRSSERSMTVDAFQPTDLSPFFRELPFTLTSAQMRAIADFSHDMCSDRPQKKIAPMTRILVGDVGSGKTVVAAAAIYMAVQNRRQAAMMVPTEILARQHYEEMAPLFEKFGFKTALLIGSMTKKQKEAVYRALEEENGIDILIGTHALLNENVHLPRLSLTITDEQHRFGVMQRAALKQKSEASHLLVMSATPIPRTLALTMYGDLDLSLLDEMPPNRQRVDTFVVDDTYKARLYGFIRRQTDAGGQVYIVCPCIDDDEDGESDLLSAVAYSKELEEQVFPDLRIAFLHGKMKSEEREKIMRAFSCHELDILVSTTVIEVGVNVPNACLMIIENAERFGLSQLHQLRGRVGRGSRKSYCVLVSNTQSDTARARLETIRSTYDGYKIAEADLEQRGPGDFFSSMSDGAFRQSGGFTLKSAHLCRESSLMESAFRAARETLERDRELSSPEHQVLLAEIQKLFEFRRDTLS